MIRFARPTSDPSRAHAPVPQRVLHRLFLTLFLRGRTSRGLERRNAPTSIGRKLALTLLLYALFGLFTVSLMNLPLFAISVSLHTMTFAFLAMFLASSAGEVLFNKEEADILLHRPISPRVLLGTKIRVLIEASLWLAYAFNLVGFYVGYAASDWRFPLVHMLSVAMEVFFCASCVVLGYQLCLKWIGRERLEGLMTTIQVLLTVAAVLGAQILPRFLIGREGIVRATETSWWISVIPPAWFASLDDALAGDALPRSWLLAALGFIATAIVSWAAFGKLAADFQTGWQRLSESTARPLRTRGGRRGMSGLVDRPPLRWWLRDPVARASFVLSAAYLLRDRDVKLRIYPALAPLMVLPVVFLEGPPSRNASGFEEFGIAFASSYLGLIPMMGLGLLQYSQHWQAADVFRAAPLLGPASICDGARKAILLILALPMFVIFAVLSVLMQNAPSQLLLLLPGLLTLPVYALVPCVGGKGVPLSLPTEEAKGLGRGLAMIVVMMISFAISGVAMLLRSMGWFWWMVLIESILAAAIYASLHRAIRKTPWRSME